MKKIQLYGLMADKYGDTFEIDVATPVEALKALDANFPGFVAYIDDNKYVVSLIDLDKPEDAEHLSVENGLTQWSSETLFIVPTTDGEITAAFLAGISSSLATAGTAATVTTAATAATFTATGAVVAAVANVTISLAVSAVVNLITSAVSKNGNKPEEEANYVFTGAINTSRQGGRMPLLYGGPMMCGSMTLSGRIVTEAELTGNAKKLEQLKADNPDWLAKFLAS